MTATSEQITRLLKDWSEGDATALDRLFPIVYDELHRIARRYAARQNPVQALQTTELINETYLRLVGRHQKEWHNRAHFYAVAAKAMRCIVIDRVRALRATKRGAGREEIPMDEISDLPDNKVEELLALEEALRELELLDPRKCRVVELRFFGGWQSPEIADFLQISLATVKRDWEFARAWLQQRLNSGGSHDA